MATKANIARISSRRPVRREKRAHQLAARKAVKRAVAGKQVPLRELFAARDAAIDRNRFDLVGQVILLRTEHGDMSFGMHGGPLLAQLEPGAMDKRLGDVPQPFVLLSPWRGLPDDKFIAQPAAPCPACTRTCHYCDGKKQVLCWGINCGGYGKQILTYKTCPEPDCVRSGKVKPDCATCHESGRVVGQTAECTVCHGNKPEGSEYSVADCTGCNGAGIESTGLKGGALPTTQEQPLCPQCEGSRKVMRREPQELSRFALGELEGFTVLGPIGQIVLYADAMRDPSRKLEVWDVRPDAGGNLAALLVAHPERAGQRMYLMGGFAIRP